MAAAVWGFVTGAEFMTVLARRRTDLAALVIVGSLYLGDARQPFTDMRIDRRTVLEEMASALDEGDWGRYFDLLPSPVDPRYQAGVRHRNDPAEPAQSVRAAERRAGGFVLPGVPTFAYWGEEEPFHRANVDRVEGMPVSWATVPGNVAGVFHAVEEVVELVDGFLRPVTVH